MALYRHAVTIAAPVVAGVIRPCQHARAYFARRGARGRGETGLYAGRKTVATVDFTDGAGEVTCLGRYLAEEFSVHLRRSVVQFSRDRTHADQSDSHRTETSARLT